MRASGEPAGFPDLKPYRPAPPDGAGYFHAGASAARRQSENTFLAAFAPGSGKAARAKAEPLKEQADRAQPGQSFL